jgi:hypothetical protein
VQSYKNRDIRPQNSQIPGIVDILARNGLVRSNSQFIGETRTDDLIIASAIYDHSPRLRSYKILAEVHKALGRERALRG